jgi:hypothetical protein
MNKILESAVEEFSARLCEKYPALDMKSLKEMWKITKKNKSHRKKMNCYNLFTKEQSCEVKRVNPTMSFANRSREMGRRWKALSREEKDHYKLRARLYQTYQHHDGWDTYMEKSREYLLHIATNWFEDDPLIKIHTDMSKEEVIELLLLHTHVQSSSSAVEGESESLPLSSSMEDEGVEETYAELLKRVKQRFPGYSDGSYTSKEDLLELLKEKKEEERIPLEVHPYYYQLLQKSLEALHHLCDKNFAPEMWKGNATDRRALMELLIRHFDHLELD